MTRKDFQLIADVIKTARATYGDPQTIGLLAQTMAKALETTNPRFDADRFIEATK